MARPCHDASLAPISKYPSAYGKFRLQRVWTDGGDQRVSVSPTNNDLFYRLVWPHRADVLRAALLLTHHESDAQDITQETIIKAWRAIDRFDSKTGAMLPWLLTILRHCWVDRLRAAGRHGREISLDDWPEDPPAPVDTGLSGAGEITNPDELLNTFSDQEIIAALRSLPAEMRWTLLLVDVAQFDYEMAAQTLAVPVGTVRSRVHRGRAMLLVALTARGAASKSPGA